MHRYLAALRAGALAGALAGAAIGLAHWSWVWPKLSVMATMRAVALGWLGGVVVVPALEWLLRRRAAAPGSRGRERGRRVVSIALSAAALAPAALWVSLAAQEGSMRRAMQGGRRPGDARPSVVLITIDALRADHVGAYGSSAGLTPNLDAFAREATRYEAAYVSAPWTLASFGTIFTSRPPSACGLKIAAVESTDWYTKGARLPESIPVVSEQLRRAGYVTAAEVTNPFLFEGRGWKRGFDHFRNEDGSDVRALITPETARAEVVTENARLWLKMNRREPFFLWVHYLDPHAPYDSPDTPAALRARYPREWRTGRAYWLDQMREQPQEMKAQYADFCRTMYAEEVRYADRRVGELLTELKRAGKYRESLVVITADHGEELFDHQDLEHGHTMYEELLWVPLLVKWPEGWQSDERVRQTVGLIDLAPTFLDVAQATPMEGMQGQMLPVQDTVRGAEVYSEAVLCGPEQTALTSDEYKVIYRPYASAAGAEFEIYDRRRDRREQHNLADQHAAPGLRDRLMARTEAARAVAIQWHPGETAGTDRLALSEQTKRKLQTLGYLGD